MRRFGVALLLCSCLALAGCGGQRVPHGYLAKGHLVCSPEHPPLDVHALIGRRLQDARGVAERQDCILRVTTRDGEWLGGLLLLLHPELDVAVVHGKVVGVAPHGDR